MADMRIDLSLVVKPGACSHLIFEIALVHTSMCVPVCPPQGH